MALRRGYRILIWAVVSVVALFALPILYLFGTSAYQSWAVQSLYDRVLASGQVPATELETGWDQMCIATAYCGGPGDLSRDICGRFLEDGVWGVVFFKENEIISIHEYTATIQYKESKLCYMKDELPVFVSAGNKTLTTQPSR